MAWVIGDILRFWDMENWKAFELYKLYGQLLDTGRIALESEGFIGVFLCLRLIDPPFSSSPF